jgi:glyoxylase-like metal-dependent hydrolase (beta-lactamase superfamily II)
VRGLELIRVPDTCNVWVLARGRDGVCIDFGSGEVLDRLGELGLDRITDVLVTHHHRDQVQGLARAVAAGARVWVPPVEAGLVADAGGHWRRRRHANSYAMRQEGFSLLESVPVTGTVAEYRTAGYGGVDVYTLPTPGHTPGSVTYLVELDGRRVAFTGDLLYGAGRVWSLAATQWSYTGVEGLASTILSCGMVRRRQPDVLLPAHGEPMDEPAAALELTSARLAELMELRREAGAPWDLEGWLDRPWRELSPHLLQNRTSIATSYALLSDSGSALILDWGYDLWTGSELGADRQACRPLLESIDALRRNHGVERVEALVTTHYHDDHVAGANLLRDVHGTEVWSPANVAPILEAPGDYDLPCLWFDPIPVDRVLPLGEPLTWREYELTAYALPGHTRYAAAIAFAADGRRVLATGDQQSREADGRMVLNYQYRNRFAIDDYAASAELYERLEPELLLTGHWGAHPLDADDRARLAADGRRLAELHRELLPVADAEGFYARIRPFRATVEPAGTLELAVEVRNPAAEAATARIRLVVPAGWRAEPGGAQLELAPGAEGELRFTVSAGGSAGRHPVAADVTIGGLRLGLHADAVVTVA